MPTYLTKTDHNGEQTRQPANQAIVNFDGSLIIDQLTLTHTRIIMTDPDGRDALIIEHGNYPGAGLSIEIAEHVKTSEP